MRAIDLIQSQIEAAANGRDMERVLTCMTVKMARWISRELGCGPDAVPSDISGSPCIIMLGLPGIRAWSTWEG